MHWPLHSRARSLIAACVLAALPALTAPAARALDIAPDPTLFARTQTLAVTQSRANWNISHLNAKASGGDGVVVWAWLGLTDMPSASKVRAAWLQQEIRRIHEALGEKGKIGINTPRHFEAAQMAGGKAFTAEFSVEYADRAFLNPIYIIPLPQLQGRLVVFGLNGKDAVVAKAAGDFADGWGTRLRESIPVEKQQ
jgi:hypothetical protein